MNSYYPENNKALYYVEFERGDKKGEFTLFKRQWFLSDEELEKMKIKSPTDYPMLIMCNEAHPWNIFTAGYGPDGTMPDRKWVEWMVDALNKNNS